MTDETFRMWLAKRRLTISEAARKLDLHRDTVSKYASGKTAVPRHVALAVSAIEAGLEEWRPQ